MLGLPTSGFARSVTKDNVSLDILCDWIESSLLFLDYSISRREIVDVLCEHGIYADQDLALTKLEDAWAVIKWRIRTLGKSTPINVSRNRLELVVESWREAPAHSFCLLLSMPVLYKNWSTQFMNDYSVQGELFEHLCKESIESKFSDWSVSLTGWSKNKPESLPSVVESVAKLINEPIGNLDLWSDGNEKEAGLDLICLKEFGDSRPGLPTFFFQCASGINWKEKLKAPDLSIWRRFINFSVQELPRKGFTLPYALSEKKFLHTANRIEGLLLDRYRLIAMPESPPNWVSSGLHEKLTKWCEPLVTKISEVNE